MSALTERLLCNGASRGLSLHGVELFCVLLEHVLPSPSHFHVTALPFIQAHQGPSILDDVGLPYLFNIPIPTLSHTLEK